MCEKRADVVLMYGSGLFERFISGVGFQVEEPVPRETCPGMIHLKEIVNFTADPFLSINPWRFLKITDSSEFVLVGERIKTNFI